MKESILTDYYKPLLESNHFIPVENNGRFNPIGQCWKLSPEIGEGFYWVYAQKDLYDIKITISFSIRIPLLDLTCRNV